MNYTITECTINDLQILREISYQTYYDTFKNSCSASIMNDYLKTAFDDRKLYHELSNNDSHFYFLLIDETPAGYLKLNEFSAQTDVHDSGALEVERIYLSKDFKGKSLGSVLMNKAISIAKEKKKEYIWLGVWEHNDNALSFYKKNGFYQIGTHAFRMGDEEQTDFIMRKDL